MFKDDDTASYEILYSALDDTNYQKEFVDNVDTLMIEIESLGRQIALNFLLRW